MNIGTRVFTRTGSGDGRTAEFLIIGEGTHTDSFGTNKVFYLIDESKTSRTRKLNVRVAWAHRCYAK
jgi:hypothetical protein